jgi:hypothetical protein
MKNIHIQYQWQTDKCPLTHAEERYYVSGPIIALNTFHRDMQRKKEMKDDRKTVIRPKLAHDQYKVIRMFETYADNANQRIESEYDLPNTGNPNDSKSKAPLPVQEEMFAGEGVS